MGKQNNSNSLSVIGTLIGEHLCTIVIQFVTYWLYLVIIGCFNEYIILIVNIIDKYRPFIY